MYLKDKQGKERDDLEYATSWNRAILHVYTKTSWLAGYCNINLIAAKKLVMKLEKMVNKFDREEVMERLIMRLENRELLQERIVHQIKKQLILNYAKHFTDGNRKKAHAQLEHHHS